MLRGSLILSQQQLWKNTEEERFSFCFFTNRKKVPQTAMVNERKYNEPEKHCSPQRVWFRREMRNRCKPYMSTQFQPCRITKLWLDGELMHSRWQELNFSSSSAVIKNAKQKVVLAFKDQSGSQANNLTQFFLKA